jgi:uncharacterized cofD-like protein
MPQTSKQQRHKKPKVVTIGGGTGQFALLSGLKSYDIDITAVVTMADDGGSTGQLRDELGVLPPGDLRQCLVALSEDTGLMRELFLHRFANGSLKGHNFGNLFLSALEQVSGSIDASVAAAGKVLSITGRVLPVTTDKVRVRATLGNGTILTGEDVIDHNDTLCTHGVRDMKLVPHAHLNPSVARALRHADLIVVGPGDLYTSLAPALVVPGMVEALARAKAPKVYVANLMNKRGHADEYTCRDYVNELERIAGKQFIDTVLYNTGTIPTQLVKRYAREGTVVPCPKSVHDGDVAYIGRAIVAPAAAPKRSGDALERTLVRHEPKKLARAILSLFYDTM